MTFDSFYDPSFHHLNSGYYWNQVINPHSDTGTLVCGSFVYFVAVDIVQEQHLRLVACVALPFTATAFCLCA